VLGLLETRRLLDQISTSDSYARWIRWFFADRATRTISAFSSVTVPEFVQRRIEENTLDSLSEALRLSPTNGLACARLALLMLKEGAKQNPSRLSEADFLSRRALELSPSDPEVIKVRAEVEKVLGGQKASSQF